jgi:hypothetical protein
MDARDGESGSFLSLLPAGQNIYHELGATVEGRLDQVSNGSSLASDGRDRNLRLPMQNNGQGIHPCSLFLPFRCSARKRFHRHFCPRLGSTKETLGNVTLNVARGLTVTPMFLGI